MTDLRALALAATPGPWRVILPGDVRWSDRRKFRCIAFSTRRDEPYTTSPLRPADAALVVAMRNGIEALLDELDALRAVREAAEDMRGAFGCRCSEAWTGRGLHEVDCLSDEGGADLLAALDAALAAGSGR